MKELLRPGFLIMLLGLLFMFIFLSMDSVNLVEKVIVTIFCSTIIIFGVLLDAGYFPWMTDEFGDTQKF